MKIYMGSVGARVEAEELIYRESREQYLAGRRIIDIADEFGISVSRVRKMCSDLPPRRNKVVLDPEQVIQLYEKEKRSAREVASILGCDSHAVWRVLRKYGIEIRGRKAAAKIRKR